MTEASNQAIAPIMDVYDFSSIGTIVDVGGGHVALLAAVLAANPSLRPLFRADPWQFPQFQYALRILGVPGRSRYLSMRAELGYVVVVAHRPTWARRAGTPHNRHLYHPNAGEH